MYILSDKKVNNSVVAIELLEADTVSDMNGKH